MDSPPKFFSCTPPGSGGILEFPGYADFAQAFPNTIPYSETLGFVADLRGDSLDYVFYTTAHEVAHQWWGHQRQAALMHVLSAQYSGTDFSGCL